MTKKEIKNEYSKQLLKICEAVPLDFFPQVEASDYLYQRISLQDIYLPIGLEPDGNDKIFDVDKLIEEIDRRLAELEREEKAQKQISKSGESKGGRTTKESEFHDELPQMLLTASDSVIEASDIPKAEKLRMSIVGDPGAGKTIFCKRLISALLDEVSISEKNDFFDDYPEIGFNRDDLPLLLICNRTDNFDEKTLNSLDFWQIAYEISAAKADITCDEFSSLMKEEAEDNRLLIILDGWDEILREEIGNVVADKLNGVLKEYPGAGFILTKRPQYNPPELSDPLAKYKISPLTEEDIRAFCKKWCSVIFSGQPEKQAWHSRIADQIIGNSRLNSLRRKPFTLALLLTLSKNDGRLADNICELMTQVVDTYVYWGVRRNKGRLNADSIKAYLKYLAWFFTSKKLTYVQKSRALDIIAEATVDLEWTLQADVLQMTPEQILSEVSQIGIFSSNKDREVYSFASIDESDRGIVSHRQFQEYLTAAAIISMCCDSTTNSRESEDIFADYFEERDWQESIVFAVLMPYSGRLCNNIIAMLLDKAEADPDDNYHYSNLLFKILANGAKVLTETKNKVYDLLFMRQITDGQINNIFYLVNLDNQTSVEFENYIDQKFRCSVEAESDDYGYAAAAIECAKVRRNGISPFARIEEVLTDAQADAADVTRAQLMLVLLAWCKYSDIKERYDELPEDMKPGFRISDKLCRCLRGLAATSEKWLDCVIELVVADMVDFDVIFPASDIDAYSASLVADKSVCEKILSVAPILLPEKPRVKCDEKVKEYYLEKLAEEIDSDKVECVFCFHVCASLGCLDNIPDRQKWWNSVSAILRDCGNDGSLAHGLWVKTESELKKIRVARSRASSRFDDYPSKFVGEIWIRESEDNNRAVYIKGNDSIVLYFDDEASEDAKSFAGEVINLDVGGKNDLAYLLRRGELRGEHISESGTKALNPIELLQEGVANKDPISLVNFALTNGDIRKNEVGDLTGATDYIMRNATSNTKCSEWYSVVFWWTMLACERTEIEGLVVLLWLYNLSVLEVEGLTIKSASKLLDLYKVSPEAFGGSEAEIIAALEAHIEHIKGNQD